MTEKEKPQENAQENELQKYQYLKRIILAEWQEYLDILKNLPPEAGISTCFKLLDEADRILNQGTPIAESDISERFLIAGLSDRNSLKRYPFDTHALGNMEGFASFKKLIKQDPEGLESALKVLPSNGPIDGWHFMQFVDAYQRWFSDNGYKQTVLYPATRLLAMKRPDFFIAMNEAGCKLLCESLGIQPLKKTDFQRYWDDIISRFSRTSWHQSMLPMDISEQPFYRARMALLERLTGGALEFDNPEYQATAPDTQIGKTPNPGQNPTLSHNKSEQLVSVQRTTDDLSSKNKVVKQPRKLTITQRKTAKVNQAAATKLMSQYYFANKKQFAHLDLKSQRETIIARLVNGESVESVFQDLAAVSSQG